MVVANTVKFVKKSLRTMFAQSKRVTVFVFFSFQRSKTTNRKSGCITHSHIGKNEHCCRVAFVGICFVLFNASSNGSNERIDGLSNAWTQIEMAQFGLFNRTNVRFDDKNQTVTSSIHHLLTQNTNSVPISNSEAYKQTRNGKRVENKKPQNSPRK